MNDPGNIRRPDKLDWESWVKRWDRMQERYFLRRAERFEITIRLIRDTQSTVTHVLDIGCGTGSLMLEVLKAFPQVKVCGIDFDPTMIWLAQARLADYGESAELLLLDLRDRSCEEKFSGHMDAVISASALHWFNRRQLAVLYRQIFNILRPGGIFITADHVGSDNPKIQQSWEDHRAQMRIQANHKSDGWRGFWECYSRALGLDVAEVNGRVIHGWEGGSEKGYPLAWHLDKLRQNGFASVDCFWRCDCDAIYGGIREKVSADQDTSADADEPRR